MTSRDRGWIDLRQFGCRQIKWTFAAGGFVVAACVAQASANIGTLDLVALAGQADPGGTPGVLFDQPTGPVLNENGQVAFVSVLTDENGQSLGFSGLSALYVIGDTNGDLSAGPVARARPGDTILPAFGGPADGTMFSSTGLYTTLSDDGVAGSVIFAERPGQANRPLVQLLSDGNGPAGVAGTSVIFGGSSPDGGDNELAGASFATRNDAGQFAYGAAYAGNEPEIGLYRQTGFGPGATRETLFRVDDPVPGGGAWSSIGTPIATINQAGQVASVWEIEQGTQSDTAVVRVDADGSLNVLAREEQSVPKSAALGGGTQTIDRINTTVALGPNGRVAFRDQRNAVFLSDDTGTTAILDVFNVLDFTFFEDVNVRAVTDAGRVVVSGKEATIDRRDAILTVDAQTVTAAAVDRQTLDRGGRLNLSIFANSTQPAVNAAGQIAFSAEILDDNFSEFLAFGLFVYDPSLGLQEIARSGDAFAGGTLDEFDLLGNRAFLTPAPNDDDFGALNEAGQLAFIFTLADGRQGVARWTPDGLGTGLFGDFDDSGSVEQADLDLVLTNWGSERVGFANDAGFASSLVDQEELDAVLTNWGSSVASSFAGFEVPEPAGLVAVAFLALAGGQRPPGRMSFAARAGGR